jgi:hypothetical protein
MWIEKLSHVTKNSLLPNIIIHLTRCPSADARQNTTSSVSDGGTDRTGSSDSLLNQFYPRRDRQGDEQDVGGAAPPLPDYLEQDHCSVPQVLSNEGVRRFYFSTSVVADDQKLIQPNEERIGTEDSVGKSFIMVSPKNVEHFIQPTDGQPLCFVADCSANLPTHIQDILYFFHRLNGCIKSHALNHYVVPTRDIQVDKPRDHPKDVRGLRQLFRHVDTPAEEGAAEEARDDAGCAYNLASSFFNCCPSSAEKEITVDLPLLKISVGFTGAVFNSGDAMMQEVFCIVTVRPARSFDIAAFIQEVFLSMRKGGMTTEGCNDLSRLRGIWTSVLQYEANMNCGLKDDPMKQQCSPYAPMGMFSLLNLLNVPLRIHYVLRRLHPGCTGVRIIGFPALSFANDEEMRNYEEYVKEYVLHGQQNLHELRLAIKTYYSTKEDQQTALEYDIKCPGGWPSRMSSSSTHTNDEVFKGWSVWRLPLCMTFALPALFDRVDYETFYVNMGNIPLLAEKKILDFKQADVGNTEVEGGCIADELVLTGGGRTLPYLQTKKYFGEEADPLKDLRLIGRMLPRWKAVSKDIRERLANGAISSSFAITLLERYMGSCMEYHSAMMKSSQYNSKHMEQCHMVGERLIKPPMVDLKLGDYLRELRRTKVDYRIRHDAYLSTSSILFMMLTDLNDDFSLNSVNLLTFFEMLISQVTFSVGSHDPTVHSFFGALEICGAQGHMDILDEKGRTCMDTRKPNTTGAGILLTCLNNLADLVGDAMGIDPTANALRTLMQQRWTSVAMENQTMYTLVGDTITSKPPAHLMDCPLTSLEGRGDTETRDQSLITIGIQRDDNVNTNVSTTSVDMEKTGVRKLQTKHQVTWPHLCGLASNCPPSNPDTPQTIGAVSIVLPPGAPPFQEKTNDNKRPANDVTSDVNSKRVKRPDDEPRKSMHAKFFGVLFWAKVCLTLPARGWIR